MVILERWRLKIEWVLKTSIIMRIIRVYLIYKWVKLIIMVDKLAIKNTIIIHLYHIINKILVIKMI
jgi:hypothetical protein